MVDGINHGTGKYPRLRSVLYGESSCENTYDNSFLYLDMNNIILFSPTLEDYLLHLNRILLHLLKYSGVNLSFSKSAFRV
jgi:recombinational DNA repair protein (RecF pathway)